MSIRTMLSRSRGEKPAVSPPRECAHWELAPRWASNDDIGKEEKVTYYTCATCHESVSRERAAAIQLARVKDL
jgi:hypothetical protein